MYNKIECLIVESNKLISSIFAENSPNFLPVIPWEGNFPEDNLYFLSIPLLYTWLLLKVKRCLHAQT